MPLDFSTVRARVNHGMRVRCEPGWRLDHAWSEHLSDCDYWFVWAGDGSMQLRDRVVRLRPGIVIWARPGGTYLAEHDPENRLGITAVHFDLIDRASGQIVPADAMPAEVWDLSNIHFIDTALRQIIDLADPRTRAATGRPITDACRATDDALMAAVLEMTLRGVTAAHDGPRAQPLREHTTIMMDLADRIRAAPGEVESIGALAEDSGYSENHFTRLFKSVTGQTPQRFVIQARIDRARQLLSETSLSVGQIADALAYRDIYFFSRQFRQVTGLTPQQYRRTRR